MCKICKFSADSKNKIINHITDAHSGNDVEKYSDYEIEEDENSSDESVLSECNVVKRKFGSRRSKISSDGTSKSNKRIILLENDSQYGLLILKIKSKISMERQIRANGAIIGTKIFI